MSNIILCPVILCGGAGTRLWPITQYNMPKPLMAFGDDTSLLYQAYDRAGLLPNIGEIVTVTNRDFFFRCRDEYRQHDYPYISTFILEPFARNTAPAIAVATAHIYARYGDEAVILVLPADHIINNHDAFLQAVKQAMTMVNDHNVITFGIYPDRPETGYGYIKAEGCTVKNFIEKPDAETARSYFASGDYLWNSGIFCFRAGVMKQEIMRNSPDIMTMATQAYINAVRYNEINCIEIMPDDFITIPDISLDFAVIEKTSNAAVIPCDMGWQDVGSWNAYTHHKHHEKDQNGNHIIGTAILQNASNCHVESRDKIVGVIGVENLIIINTPDALLVAHSDHAQDVGDITATITKKLLSSR